MRATSGVGADTPRWASPVPGAVGGAAAGAAEPAGGHAARHAGARRHVCAVRRAAPGLHAAGGGHHQQVRWLRAARSCPGAAGLVGASQCRLHAYHAAARRVPCAAAAHAPRCSAAHRPPPLPAHPSAPSCSSSRSWSPPPASDPASLLSPSCSSLLEAAGRCPVVPPAVQNYIDEVKECLAFISSCPGERAGERAPGHPTSGAGTAPRPTAGSLWVQMCEVEREWEHPATATGLRLAREQRARVAQPPSVLHPPPPPPPPPTHTHPPPLPSTSSAASRPPPNLLHPSPSPHFPPHLPPPLDMLPPHRPPTGRPPGLPAGAAPRLRPHRAGAVWWREPGLLVGAPSGRFAGGAWGWPDVRMPLWCACAASRVRARESSRVGGPQCWRRRLSGAAQGCGAASAGRAALRCHHAPRCRCSPALPLH